LQTWHHDKPGVDYLQVTERLCISGRLVGWDLTAHLTQIRSYRASNTKVINYFERISGNNFIPLMQWHCKLGHSPNGQHKNHASVPPLSPRLLSAISRWTEARQFPLSFLLSFVHQTCHVNNSSDTSTGTSKRAEFESSLQTAQLAPETSIGRPRQSTPLVVTSRKITQKINPPSSTHKMAIVTTTTVLRPFFRDYPGEPVPEENFWTLWCKGRLTETDSPTIQLGATPSGLTTANLCHPHIFYRPDALPATQPTVSKHWRQLAHSD